MCNPYSNRTATFCQPNTWLFFVLILFAFLPCHGLAEVKPDSSYLIDLSLEDLLNLKLTSVASNFEETNLQTGSSVDLITRDDWEKTSSRKLMEALEHLPSVMINTSIFSTYSAMHFRGIANTPGTRGVALLLDGVPINTAQHATALYSAQQLGLGVLDRIEIIRGAGSTLHGNDAFQGVLALQSRRFDYDTIDVHTGAGAGGYQFARFGLANSVNDNVTLSLSGDLYTIENADTLSIEYNPTDASSLGSGRTATYEHAKPSNESISFAPKITYQNSTLTLEANYIHSEQERTDARTASSFFGLVSLEQGNSNFDLFRLFANYRLSATEELMGLLYHYQDHYQYPLAIDANDTSSTSDLFDSQASYPPGAALVDADYANSRTGFDLRFLQYPSRFFSIGDIQWAAAISGSTSINQHADSQILQAVTDGDGYRRDLLSIYAESKLVSNDRNWEFLLGARLDHYSDIDDLQFSPRAGIIFHPRPSQAIKLLYANAFRAPSFAEVGANLRIGTPEVKPETIDNFELVYVNNFNNWSTEAVLYYLKLNHGIVFTCDTPFCNYQESPYENHSAVESSGIELKIDFNGDTVSSNFSISQLLKNHNTADSLSYSHFPKTIVNALISYDFPRAIQISLGARAMLDYKTFQVSRSTIETSSAAPDFLRFNLHAEKRFGHYGSLTSDIRNLLDADNLHVGSMHPSGGEVHRYEAGRSIWVGWKYSM